MIQTSAGMDYGKQDLYDMKEVAKTRSVCVRFTSILCVRINVCVRIISNIFEHVKRRTKLSENKFANIRLTGSSVRVIMSTEHFFGLFGFYTCLVI